MTEWSVIQCLTYDWLSVNIRVLNESIITVVKASDRYDEHARRVVGLAYLCNKHMSLSPWGCVADVCMCILHITWHSYH